MDKMMKNMNLFQRVCFISFCVFGGLAAIAWVIFNLVFIVLPSKGFESLASLAPILVLWMAALPSAVLCLGLLTQNRPLKDSSIFVNALSIAGITFVVLAWLYTMIMYGLAFTGTNTNSQVWGFASDIVKNGIVFGALLMYSAFVFSYKPRRLQSIRYIAVVCAVTAASFALLDLNDNFSPDIYRPFVLLFGAGAFAATLVTMHVSKAEVRKFKKDS